MNKLPIFVPLRRVLINPLQLFNNVNELGSLMPVGSIIRSTAHYLFESGTRWIDLVPDDKSKYEGVVTLVGDEIDWFSDAI